MKMFKRFLLCLLLLIPSIGYSDYLILGHKSHHFSNNPKIVRESHVLFLYEKDVYIAGYWRNSYDKNTLFIGRKYTWVSSEYVDMGVMGGVLTGYQYPISATFFTTIKYSDTLSVVIQTIPSEVIGVSLRIRI